MDLSFGRQKTIHVFDRPWTTTTQSSGLNASAVRVSRCVAGDIRVHRSARRATITAPFPVCVAAGMATTNVSHFWDLYRSDLKLSKMTIKHELPSVRFDIPILPQAPKYRPGSGPPPPRIDLRLVHDTNAYIIDKIVLPLEPFTQRNDPRQRRVYYIIGWPDLPAARPVIDATKILDYVSPRAVEDWEYQDALRREEARDAEERAIQKGKVATAPGKAPGAKPGMRRKAGRPPGARLKDAPPPEPLLDSDQEEMLQRRKSGPSLSTPQKSRLAQLVAEEEMLEHLEVVREEDPASVIQRQLEGGAPSGDEMDLDAGVGLEETNAGDSWRSRSVASWASGGETSRASSTRTGASKKLPMNPASSLSRTSAAPATTTRGSPFSKFAEEHVDPSTSSSSRRLQTPTLQPTSDTPRPLPPHSSQSQKHKSSKPKPKGQAQSLSRSVVPSIETSMATGGQSTLSTSQYPVTHESMGRRGSSSSQPSTSPGYGFTPIGGTFPRPPKRPAEDISPGADTPASTQLKKERKKKHTEQSQPPSESVLDGGFQDAADPAVGLVQEPQDYVVKRLEGDSILDGVHWFKVRWEGNWPPDQNPTWEPKDNISAKLVKEYLNRKAKREAEKSSKNNTLNAKSSGPKKHKEKRQSSLAEWAKRYNSVSEAFEGKAGLDATTDAMLGRPVNGEEPEDEEGGSYEELLVVEPGNDEDQKKAGMERKKRLDAQLAAQFASMARGGPRDV